MQSNFDAVIDRHHSDSLKWRRYDSDVLPLWVADMDFAAPPVVVEAIRARAEHPVYGYSLTEPELFDVIVQRMLDRYGWKISAEDIMMVPGVVTGFNWAAHAVGAPGDEILVQTPVYHPILEAPANAHKKRVDVELTRLSNGRYAIDFDRFEQAITELTSMFLLCNPHNPSGRVFTRQELERLAEICLKHNVTICSDEIHCDLIFHDHRHIPIASLAPEIANRTITLIAPSKTYNIAGLKCSFAIVPNPDLRQALVKAEQGLIGWINLFGTTAAFSAYRDGQPWLDELLKYLEANRDYLFNFIQDCMPSIHMAKPEGTYLAWLDCRDSSACSDPQRFFLDKARVGLNDGTEFGKGGKGFVRLNFGCPRATLTEALERMASALAQG